MKSLTCKACGHIETGSSEKEVMDKTWEHIKQAHKEIADKAMEMPKEEQEKMMNEARMEIKDM